MEVYSNVFYGGMLTLYSLMDPLILTWQSFLRQLIYLSILHMVKQLRHNVRDYHGAFELISLITEVK